jgi:DNA-binding NarL/FixJ family response regulator
MHDHPDRINRSLRVLLIDDSRAMRTALRGLLEDAGGFSVVGEAADGADGLAMAGLL